MTRIDLQPTRELHDLTRRMAIAEPGRLQRILVEANRQKERAGGGLMGGKKLPDVTMTALTLDRRDVEDISRLSRRLHRIVEHLLDRLVAEPGGLSRHLPSHAWTLPYLRKTPGSDHWQIVSRYDLAVSPDGDLRVMELNTSCPGGFMIVSDLIEPTRLAFREAGLHGTEGWRSINAEPDVIIDSVLRLEAASGLAPGLIGVLNDENQLQFELDRIVGHFRRRGRECRIIDARELRYAGGLLTHQAEVVSAAFNKFRISTPDSANHCWTRGFEERYADFLGAQRDGVFVPVNNLCGMSVAEDKELLGLFFDPELTADLPAEDRELIREQVLWTSRLEEKETLIDGSRVDLLDFVRRHRERFVIKPSNEGRGFGVVIGKFVSESEWESACRPDPKMPCVVQEFSESCSLPVATNRDGNLRVETMLLTLAIAITSGTPGGLISRVSPDPVTNVAKSGFLQAVFLRE